eukprot:8138476-Pyramimonas_sp.AAC.1
MPRAGAPGVPQEASGNHRKPQEAPGGPKKHQCLCWPLSFRHGLAFRSVAGLGHIVAQWKK